MLWLERNTRTFFTNSDTPVGVAAKAREQLDLWCRACLVDRSSLFDNVT
jgi:hypothetical protein